MSKRTVLSEFRISDEDLEAKSELKEAYRDYSYKRFMYAEAFKALNEAIDTLHMMLDGPLRAQGRVPDGKDWSLKEDDEDGVRITVWSEPKRRGRSRKEVLLQAFQY